MPATKSAKRRVIALCKAISDLHHGDLLTILELDRVTAMEDFGDNDMFTLEGNKVIHMPGSPPPPKSLKHRAGTGEELYQSSH
jgi:hypothetical protein